MGMIANLSRFPVFLPFFFSDFRHLLSAIVILQCEKLDIAPLFHC